jgi:Ca-activated chloride channel family protein
MGEFTFEYPWVALIGILFLFCSRYCQARREAILFPHLDIFRVDSSSGTKRLKILKWLSIIFALVALASPVVEDKLEVEKKEGYSIALVLDASGSMKFGFGARYFGMPSIGNQDSKFTVSMDLAKSFVKKRKDDQIALIVFGNFAYVAAPLTYDEVVLEEIMQGLYPGIAGSNYTVINDALFQSAKLFSNSKAKTKVAILLTDGQSRGDNVPFDVAMKLVKKYGVKVYTIGIGKREDFDGKHLKAIANATGGLFFSAASKEDLQAVYEKIDAMEKSSIESERYIKKSYFFEYPLFLAFAFLLFYTFLLNREGTA